MARVTVEDCLKKIPNRFELVLCAAYRARQISQGYAPKVDAKDKPRWSPCAKSPKARPEKRCWRKFPAKTPLSPFTGPVPRKGQDLFNF